MSKVYYQTLTVNVGNGNCYWQKPQDTAKDAVLYAIKRTRNLADMFIYKVPERVGSIELVKTILHSKEEHGNNM